MFVMSEDPKEQRRQELYACVDTIVDADPVMSGVAMTAMIDAAHTLHTAADGAIVAVAPAWVASGDWEVQGHTSAAACLSARTGRRRSASYDLLRTAAVARDAPALLDAATTGALSLGHLSLIAK